MDRDEIHLRRMHMLDDVYRNRGKSLSDYTDLLRYNGVSNDNLSRRTVYRDIEYINDLAENVRGIIIQHGKVCAEGPGHSSSTFAKKLVDQAAAKAAIGQKAAQFIRDDMGIAMTAGTTVFSVARALRKRYNEPESGPKNIVVYSNNLPVINLLANTSVEVNMFGEKYNPDDCAFHSKEFHGTFLPEIVFIGTSGIIIDPCKGTLDLCTDRNEEADFYHTLISRAKVIVVVADASKMDPQIGTSRRYSFTRDDVLHKKQLILLTSTLPDNLRADLSELSRNAFKRWSFLFEQVDVPLHDPNCRRCDMVAHAEDNGFNSTVEV